MLSSGDLKFIFMMLGRGGYAGTQCLYCRLKIGEWKKQHQEGSLRSNGSAWSIAELLNPFLEAQKRNQALPTTKALADRGQKEYPLWTFIPIANVIVSVLHILLGLGNDGLSFFLASGLTKESTD